MGGAGWASPGCCAACRTELPQGQQPASGEPPTKEPGKVVNQAAKGAARMLWKQIPTPPPLRHFCHNKLLLHRPLSIKPWKGALAPTDAPADSSRLGALALNGESKCLAFNGVSLRVLNKQTRQETQGG